MSNASRDSRLRVPTLAAFLAAMATALPAVSGECPRTVVRIESSYREPQGFEYAPRHSLDANAGADATRDSLGAITTSVGWDVEVGVTRRCLGEECRVCVNRIDGRAGFEPGRVQVDEALRGDRCRTDLVLAHELRHSRVFDESTRLGVQRLLDSLARWAAQQEVIFAAPEAAEAAAKARFREIERMMEEGVGWMSRRARAENDSLDSPRAYDAERERMERSCGKSE